MKRHPLICGLLLASSHGAATAQLVLRTHDGEETFDQLSRIARIADLDADGVDDILLGAPVAGTGEQGRIYVLSGATGFDLGRVDGSLYNAILGSAVADAGDFDGDGVHDILAGAPGDPTIAWHAGRADVYSGATLALLASTYGTEQNRELGRCVAGIGDVDGDGFDDVAVGGNTDYARILGGPDGHLIRTHNGPPVRAAVSGLGDVNADGRPDYIIGWARSSVNGTWTGTVRVYSGVNGSVIHAVHGDRAYDSSQGFDGDHLGYAVTAIGDLDQDGVQDFAAGAPGGLGNLFATGPGFVRGYSGATAAVLFTLVGEAEQSTLGMGVASGDDINGDGVLDLIAGAPAESQDHISQGAVYGSSNRSNAVLWKILGEESTYDLGEFVAILDDLDGDGYAEFAVGDPWASYTALLSGRVTIYRGAPGDAVRTCSTSANSTGRAAHIEIDGAISMSYATMSLRATDAVPGQFGLFFYGANEVENPFGNGTLCAGPPIFRLPPPQVIDSSGATSRVIDFSAPPVGSGAGAWTAGSTWILQFWYRDPMGGGAFFNLSDAMRLTPTP